MRRLLLIGIGSGDPDHVTVQAVQALRAVDVFFVIDKGPEKADLAQLRLEICRRHIPGGDYRIVEVPDPERDRAAAAYGSAVRDWRGQRAERLERAILAELPDGGCGGLLVWGDPSLYDSTIDVVEQIVARGRLELRYEVIPGIGSVQALAARHRIPLNRVGGQVLITTGRRLREGFPDCEDVIVMLDAECSFRALAGEDIDIYWGAYLGAPDEILIAGRVGEVADEIEHARAQARERKGWIMDTYLLRRAQGWRQDEAPQGGPDRDA